MRSMVHLLAFSLEAARPYAFAAFQAGTVYQESCKRDCLATARPFSVEIHSVEVARWKVPNLVGCILRSRNSLRADFRQIQ
jgi:hypothetical protein